MKKFQVDAMVRIFHLEKEKRRKEENNRNLSEKRSNTLSPREAKYIRRKGTYEYVSREWGGPQSGTLLKGSLLLDGLYHEKCVGLRVRYFAICIDIA